MELMKIMEVGGVDDSLALEVYDNDTACLEIDSPWDGDTQSGIGRTASFTLTKEQARALAAKLMEWAGKA